MFMGLGRGPVGSAVHTHPPSLQTCVFSNSQVVLGTKLTVEIWGRIPGLLPFTKKPHKIQNPNYRVAV